MEEEELNTLNMKITECLLNASKKIATKGKDKKEKLGRDTLNLIKKKDDNYRVIEQITEQK